MRSSTRRGLTFGIYPGSAVGDVEPAGPPDQPDRINQALGQLQGFTGRPFTVRAYDAYVDPGDTIQMIPCQAPAGYDRYLGRGRTLDLVAQYHSRSGDVQGYCAFIEALIDRHGEHLATLQVGEEPNITDNPHLDGAYPRITEALTAGVRAAKEKARRSGHPGLKVGCNSSPLLGPAGAFFTVTGYTHHTLRDARSAGSGLFCCFGLMTDDYTPKPAFHVYRDMINTLS